MDVNEIPFVRSENNQTSKSRNNSDKRVTSLHSVSDGRPLTISKSEREKKTDTATTKLQGNFDQRGNAGNVYSSERAKRAKYQPSLDYPLGVSKGSELKANTFRCSSTFPKSIGPLSYQHGELHGKYSTHSESRSSLASKINNTYSGTGSDTDVSSPDSCRLADVVATSLSSREQTPASSLSSSQKDLILCDIIQNGDRVSVTVTQKPPIYGSKKPKPIIYTGIVKYKGPIDTYQNDTGVYVGVRLDAPVGESDGTYQRKRYMFTPPGYAKFFKIHDLDSVLDVSSGMYIPTSKLILYHQENSPVPA